MGLWFWGLGSRTGDAGEAQWGTVAAWSWAEYHSEHVIIRRYAAPATACRSPSSGNMLWPAGPHQALCSKSRPHVPPLSTPATACRPHTPPSPPLLLPVGQMCPPPHPCYCLQATSAPLPWLRTEPAARVAEQAASLMHVLCFTLAASVLSASYVVFLVR